MVAPHRSASIDALRRAMLTVWPGMTIYWIGDLAHQGGVSGHNPDDYTGVRAEMLDDDTDPEVRALDGMVGPKFSAADGTRLVQALISGADRRRLYYVIYRSTIYRRTTNFRAESYGGANHNDHVHISGHSSDDENGADWTSVLALGEEDDVITDADVDRIAKACARAWHQQRLGASSVTAAVAAQETHLLAKQIAKEVNIDAAELVAIQAAVEAGVVASADELVAAILAQLPDTALSKEDVEAAVRSVFADAATP